MTVQLENPRTAPKKFLVVVRTHYFDDEFLEFYRWFGSADLDVVAVVDEGRGPVEFPAEVHKLSLDAATLERLGLYFAKSDASSIGDAGWRCGDYSLYIARDAYRDYENYLLIEPDVLFNTADPARLPALAAAWSGTDLMAANLRKAESSWFWSATMRPFDADVRRCLFPFVWMSAAAVDLALQRRRELSKTAFADDTVGRNWPNDESFVATTICNAGLSFQDIAKLDPPLCDGRTMSFHRPLSMTLVKRADPDEKVYHPVLAGQRFLRKANDLLAVAGGVGGLSGFFMFDAAFDAALRAECSASEYADFNRRLTAHLRTIGKSVFSLRCHQLLRKLYRSLRQTPE